MDFKVSGPVRAPASLEIATKVAYAVDRTLSVGVESYNGLGELNRLGEFGNSGHQSFLVIDKSFGRWDLNLGIGSGYGAERDRFVLKAVIGVPISS